MQRATVVVAIAMMCSACDPIRVISTSRAIRAPLDQACVLETLRKEPTVRSAGVYDHGGIWVDLIIPEGLEVPTTHPKTSIDVRRNERDELEVVFATSWIGTSGRAGYCMYVQDALEELRDHVIEKCGGN